MILPRFQFIEPEKFEELFEITEKNRTNLVFLAGGTDLLVKLKQRTVEYSHVISLAKLPGLKTISYSEKTGCTLGAITTISELAESSIMREKYPLLAIAADKLGSPQIRNRATVGGNICTARPAGDTIGPLLTYDAVVILVSRTGERRQSLAEFILGPGETTLEKGEILADIYLPPALQKTGTSYIKYGARKAMEIATVSITTAVASEKSRYCDARVVLGAVAPTFIRSRQAEDYLLGKEFTPEVIREASRLAAASCRPISDIRASAEYRRQLVEVLTRRSLMEATSRCP